MALWKKQVKQPASNSYWLKSAVILFLCILAGFVGAKLQELSYYQANNKISTKQVTPNSEEQTVQKLAYEIGQLRGRLIAVENMRNQISKAAGLEQNLAELDDELQGQYSKPQKNPVSLQTYKNGSLASLQNEIVSLDHKLTAAEDAYYFMSLSQSLQSGFHASLPTFKPVKYPALSSSFGWRKHPVTGKSIMHEGLDFAAPWGSPIKAASGGLVVFSGYLGGYGNMVEVDHGNGLHTRYGHASKLLVKTGDIVHQGQLIAKVGSTGRSTGAHLHFEVRMADYPLDPSLFINNSINEKQIFAKNEPVTSANKS